MKLLLYGDVDPTWPEALRAATPDVEVVSTEDAEIGQREIADADAFFGFITPDLLSEISHIKPD